jgi:hypothetical protein
MLNSPSPIDDIIDQSMNSDMPAWKSANQELAGILSNLRKIEHHLDFYSASSLKQLSADRHVAPLGQIILIPRHPVFGLCP